MRISTNHFYSNVLGSIQKEYLGGARAHEQIASGLRINRLSEDPSALSQILSLRSSNNEIENYLLSIDQQISRLNRAEEALAQATETMHDVRDIAVQGSTGTYTPADLKNLAFQVDQTITAIVGFANATLGRIRPEEMYTRATVVEIGDDAQPFEREIVTYKPPEFGKMEGVEGEGWGRVLTLHMLISTIDPATVFGAEPGVIINGEFIPGEIFNKAQLNLEISNGDAEFLPDTVFVPGMYKDGEFTPGVVKDGEFTPLATDTDNDKLVCTVGADGTVTYTLNNNGDDDTIVINPDDLVYRATMFDTLFELRDLLEHGKLPGENGADDEDGEAFSTRISNLLTDFDRHLDTLVQGRSDLGSRAYQLEKLSKQIGVQKEQLTEVLAKVGDTDVAEAMVRLSRHDLVLRATLLTATRLMDISLLNYLR